MTDGKGQTTSYTYDVVDRVLQVTYADSSTITYVYDADGNLTSTTDNTGTTSFSYDILGRMTPSALIPNTEQRTSACGFTSSGQFDGWYPSLVSGLGTAPGHTSKAGYVFFLKGCETGADRQFMRRAFTIQTSA